MTPIVDAHTHCFPPWLREHRQRYVEYDVTFQRLYADPRARIADAGEIVEAMDQAGIDTSIVMGIGWTDPGLARDCNDYLLDMARRFPDRLIPFCSVNPAWGSDAAGEVERCARRGARGVGELHPDTQGFDLDRREVMAPVMTTAQAMGLVVLTHASEPVGHPYPGKGSITPGVLMRLIEHFPDVSLVLAHWGGGLPFYALMPEVRAAIANVYFDTAATPFLYTGDVFTVVRDLLGAGRILFATDFPLMPQSRVLQQVGRAPIREDERSAILGGNAARLLGLSPGP